MPHSYHRSLLTMPSPCEVSPRFAVFPAHDIMSVAQATVVTRIEEALYMSQLTWCAHCRLPVNKGLGAGKFENLYTAMHAAMRPQGAQGVKDVVVRQVEQGARLLAAPPHGVQVILQMPRGNLEGICPRVLVLAGIAAHLQVEEKMKTHAVIAKVTWHANCHGKMVVLLDNYALQASWDDASCS